MQKAVSSLEEVWKDIPGYEGWYQVSNLGRVKRLKKIHYSFGQKHIIEREKILNTSKTKKGYLNVVLTNDGNNKKSFRVHRLVAMVFIPNTENKNEVDHINRIRDDNRVSNLRWATARENRINSSKCTLLEYKGVVKHLSEWCKIKNKKIPTVVRRLQSGWSVEDALDNPVDTRFYKKNQEVYKHGRTN